MARIFTSGAEEVDPRALWDYFDTIANAQPVPVQFFGPTDQVTFAPRTGRGMYGLSSAQYLYKSFGASVVNTEMYFGFGVRFPILGNQFEFFKMFTDNPNIFNTYSCLRITAGGAVEARRGGTILATSVAGVIIASTWYYFEVWFKPLDANGRFVVKVDGVIIIDYTGDTTDNKQYLNGWGITGIEADQNRPPTCFDDIVANDTVGAVNISYPGIVKLLPIRPHAPGTDTAWTRAGVDLGSDEAQAIEGTYEFAMLQTAAADQLENFDPEIPDLPAGAVITNIIVEARARVQAGAGVIAPMVISNGTPNISADQTLVSAWRYYQYAWALNPDDAAAWAEADLALLEIGVSS